MSCKVEVTRQEVTRRATPDERAVAQFPGRFVKVGEVFRVVLLINEGAVSDGMWVRLVHAAKFTTAAEAEKLAERVRKAVREKWLNPESAINPACWTWSASMTNAIRFMQQPSTATEYLVA